MPLNKLIRVNSMENIITRIRHPLVQRNLRVLKTQLISFHMLRIWLTGPELKGFISQSPDDHIKLFFPTPDGAWESRDYTPRFYDEKANILWIDFALHDGGIATTWARQAKTDDILKIGGPKGSTIISHHFDWWLLVGDETAIPAISRRLEEMTESTKVMCVLSVRDATHELSFQTFANTRIFWTHRHNLSASDPTPLIHKLSMLDLSSQNGFAWIAAEAKVARGVREFLREKHEFPLNKMKTSGYWVYGKTNAHEKFNE